MSVMLPSNESCPSSKNIHHLDVVNNFKRNSVLCCTSHILHSLYNKIKKTVIMQRHCANHEEEIPDEFHAD